MDLSQVRRIYFVGIGGIGMSSLARYFHQLGYAVGGYDKTPSPVTRGLESEGISVTFDHTPQVNDELPDFVVRTPAVPADNPLLHYFQEKGIPLYKRSEVLGMITRKSPTIAVAGTHGKTTVSTMTAHLLKHAGVRCAAFLGGISLNYNTNLLLDENAEWTVVEADEYDRSFLQLYPKIGTITSVDADHLDIYSSEQDLHETFKTFTHQIDRDGKLIINDRVTIPLEGPGKPVIYSSKKDANIQAINLKSEQGHSHFDLEIKGQVYTDFRLSFPGRHNVENACAAVAAALEAGVSPEQCRQGLAAFKGIFRRYEYKIHQEDLIYIDDYAHHPEELRAVIEATRELFPGKSITGIFQPHLFSRTRDFADGFAESLSLLDEIFLLDIYPAREKPLPGVDSQMLLDRIVIKNKKLVKKDALLAKDFFKNKNLQILMTLGAGDIGELANPLRDNLLEITAE
ncbi:UDP-N-acetylmuramate--L-alanine ligase [bacterium SCSIO 12741]|nr:UDP-N-acetylmuramate--L-alanine ligase [bacterium SCSIO 12741]